MEGGVWVILGSLLGAAGSIATTWVSASLNRRTKFPAFDKAANELLLSLLNEGDARQDIKILAATVGMSEKHTKEYLIVLGARGYGPDGQKWGLISKNPPLKAGASPAELS